MALTTEQAAEILSKVTGLPTGLFVEASSRTRNNLTAKIFECEAESDEYTLMIDSKDQVFEIKNSYTTFNRDTIERRLNPSIQASSPTPAPLPGGAVFKIGQAAAAAAGQAMSTYVMPNPISDVMDFALLKQYVADFVQLNPGCVLNLIDPADQPNVQESLLHTSTVWEFSFIAGGDLTDIEVNFSVTGTGNGELDDEVTAVMFLNVVSNTVTSIEVSI